MKVTEDELMTVGGLRERLASLPSDARIFFGCHSLTFLRIKKRGDRLFQMEFSQNVHDDEDGNVHVDNPPS